MRESPLDGRPARACAASALAALAVCASAPLSGCGGGSTHTSSSTAQAGAKSAFEGAPFPAGIHAPGFTLSDQDGRAVSLSDYRGRVVALTFLYSTCGDTCAVIAQQIRGALDELQSEHARAPAVLMVSADPAADTAPRVRAFLSEASLTGRAQFLTGTPAQLRAVWRAYRVKPASAGARLFAEYASVLLIDGAGEERVLFESEELTPEALSHDVGKLYGDPAGP
ncbi:MAG TPA: SCO family protein [Solirubrobacteraceae bacterium]|jgi:protein SCO1/2|nr:SCO family protein [Solirubrobacteraceae bacterium]